MCHLGDLFQTAATNILRSEVKDGHLKAGHDKAFRPAKIVPSSDHKTEFEHKTNLLDVKKKYRDDEGFVITSPRNFVTSPPKKGIASRDATFGGFPEHVPDDYNYPKKKAQEELKYHHSKLQEKPFSQAAKKKETFSSVKEVYGEDIPIPPKKEKSPPKHFEHEVAFKPAQPPKAGHKATFNPFPEYKENPLKSVERKRPVEGEEPPPSFKSPRKMMAARPTPSIQLNVRNLKASMPSAFRM